MLFAPTRNGSEVFDIVVAAGAIEEPGIKASTIQKRHELREYIGQRQGIMPVSVEQVAAELGWSAKEVCLHLLALIARNAIKCRMPSQTAVFRLTAMEGTDLLEGTAGDVY